MRLVFFGTPADAVPVMRALHDAGHEIALVVTQPDRRRRRGPGVDPTPVKVAAEELGLAVRTPERAKDVVDDVRASGAELGVVVAFGQLLPPTLLDAVPLGFVNVHYSLLPRWRGAAPVERAVLAGDATTGVCIMQIEEGLDTGGVYARAETPIGAGETAGELRTRLTDIAMPLLLDVVTRAREITPEPQRGEATYAEKLTTDEFRLDARRAADELARRVRAANPHPGAWFTVDGKRVKVLRAHAEGGASGEAGALVVPGRLMTSEGTLVLDEVQPEGKRTMSGDAWSAGLRAPRLAIDGA